MRIGASPKRFALGRIVWRRTPMLTDIPRCLGHGLADHLLPSEKTETRHLRLDRSSTATRPVLSSRPATSNVVAGLWRTALQYANRGWTRHFSQVQGPQQQILIRSFRLFLVFRPMVRRAADMLLPGGRGSCRAKSKLGRSLALPQEDLAGRFQFAPPITGTPCRDSRHGVSSYTLADRVRFRHNSYHS